MGSTEVDRSTKEAKEEMEAKTSTSQEQALSTSNGAVNPEWSGFQAYSPIPPHGFLASSPQPHPYMWGVQHLMPPYGAPPHPYVAMYPHGGIYAHPSIPPGSYPFSPFAMPSPNGIPEASGNTLGSNEVDGKSSEGKEKLPIKRCKGSVGNLNTVAGNNNEPGKASGASAIVDYSKSGDSGSDDYSEGSDVNSQNDTQMKSGLRPDSSEDPLQNGSEHGSQNGGPNQMANLPISPAGAPTGVVPGPAMNLNIGMDYWGAPVASPALPAMRPSASVAGAMATAGAQENVQPRLWLQDERELKKQRRKQSNRESARRSRLRKQVECDELAQRADVLKEENNTLRSELSRIRSEYEQLLAQNASLKGCPSSFTSISKPEKLRSRVLAVRASGSSGENSGENLSPVAPLRFESPVGQFLDKILRTLPHLLPAAIDKQLENLQNDRDAQQSDASASSQDLLYKRIAEVKEKDRQKALEEIIYCLIVEKFMEKNISMIPKISNSDLTGRVDFWPNQEQKLESVHSPEAFEMILSHLSLVLGDRVVGPLDTIVQISKIKLGKLYAASIMYGYFLRRVDERYQLERSMNTLPPGFDENLARFQDPTTRNPLWDAGSLIVVPPPDDDYDNDNSGKLYKLRSYVTYLDAETLQRYATIRSREAISLIEKQTQALFGRPDIRVSEDGSLGPASDEAISVTFSGLTMLVLEAVAFGSFLWDAEGYVESKYHFIKS